MRPGTAPGAGGVTLDHDRLDLGAVDLTGLSREDVLAALTDAALEAFDELGPADFAVPLRPARFTPWTAEFGFDPEEARDEAGKWTAGGAGAPGAGGAGDTPRRSLVAQGLRIADAHRQNMRALLAKMRSGDYSPSDVEHDVTRYENDALKANEHCFRLRYAGYRDRVAAAYGEAAVRSPEWVPVRTTFREAQDQAAGHIQGMATHVRLLARRQGRVPEAPAKYGPADLRTLEREHKALVSTYGDFPLRLGDEFDEFEKTHKPLPGHAGFSADAEFAFDPNEPRDEKGEWTAGGGGTKSERSAARVGRKRAERAAERQESGRAKNRNDALAAVHQEVAFTRRAMPLLTGADGYFLQQAEAGVHPNELVSYPLADKAVAFRRLRDEATRVAARLRRNPDAQPHLTGVRRANALNGLREIARRADGALGLIRREATSRRLPGVQSAQFGSTDAEFYSPDQPRDDRGRWTAGGGEGAAPTPTQADRAVLRQASLTAVRAYVRAGGEPTHVEHEQLAAHLARLTVDQLHAVKVEHGLRASGRVKSDLVARLAERFRLHRAKQEPAGRKALAEAVAGREGWHAPRDVMGGHAALHGPTGARVRADSAGTMFDVLTSGSGLHSSHATAADAVRAAEVSNRFGTGGTTAEREHAARQEAIVKARERAAAEKVGVGGKPGLEAELREWGAGRLDPGQVSLAAYRLGRPLLSPARAEIEHRRVVTAALQEGLPVPPHVLADYPGLAARHAPAAAPPAPAGGGLPRQGEPHPEEIKEAAGRVFQYPSSKGWWVRDADPKVGVLPAPFKTKADALAYAVSNRRAVESRRGADYAPYDSVSRADVEKHRAHFAEEDSPESRESDSPDFSEAAAPRRPVRFVPLVQPAGGDA